MILSVDIDGTIFDSELLEGEYWINKVNQHLILKLNSLFEAGVQIIIHTGRHWNHMDLTKRQLDHYGVKYTTLVMGKPVADHYIDDKAVRPDEFLGR
jgi:hydroxymethylpyrimidine pyrophosphatase-like HAD family hydrolase